MTLTSPPPSAEQFYNWLAQETAVEPAPLDESSQKELKNYYRSQAAPERASFACYNWSRRTEPMRALLLSLPRGEHPWRVLDAGCGLGTEAYYWSSLRADVEVLGVDISPERLALAGARRPYYEQQAGRELNVRYREGDIFKVLASERYDVIWSMEAISHIDPAERFLRAAAASLSAAGDPDRSNQAGWLVISDSNRANPYMLWRIYRLRQKIAARGQRTLPSGETIGYAHERLFSVPELAHLLRQAGFGQIDAQLSVFFPPALARLARPYARLDAALNALPLLRRLGGIYTVSAGIAG